MNFTSIEFLKFLDQTLFLFCFDFFKRSIFNFFCLSQIYFLSHTHTFKTFTIKRRLRGFFSFCLHCLILPILPSFVFVCLFVVAILILIAANYKKNIKFYDIIIISIFIYHIISVSGRILYKYNNNKLFLKYIILVLLFFFIYQHHLPTFYTIYNYYYDQMIRSSFNQLEK